MAEEGKAGPARRLPVLAVLLAILLVPAAAGTVIAAETGTEEGGRTATALDHTTFVTVRDRGLEAEDVVLYKVIGGKLFAVDMIRREGDRVERVPLKGDAVYR